MKLLKLLPIVAAATVCLSAGAAEKLSAFNAPNVSKAPVSLICENGAEVSAQIVERNHLQLTLAGESVVMAQGNDSLVRFSGVNYHNREQNGVNGRFSTAEGFNGAATQWQKKQGQAAQLSYKDTEGQIVKTSCEPKA